MQGTTQSRRVMRTTMSVLAAAIVAGYVGQQHSFALPAYAKREGGLKCAYCHQGKPPIRNYRGKFYEKNHNFENFDDYAEAVAANAPELAPVGVIKPTSVSGLAPLTAAHDKVTAAQTAHQAAPDDAKLTKAYADSLTDLAKAVLDSKITPAKAKYTNALKVANDALAFDANNATAQAEKKTAEDGIKAEEAKEKAAAEAAGK